MSCIIYIYTLYCPIVTVVSRYCRLLFCIVFGPVDTALVPCGITVLQDWPKGCSDIQISIADLSANGLLLGTIET